MKINAKFRFQLLIQNGIFLGLLLGIAATLVFLAEESNVRWDLTHSQRNTLSPATLDILKKIEAPIRITAFVTTDAEGDLRQPIVNFLTPYQLEKSNLEFAFINPREDPFAAKKAGVTVNGELVVDLDGRIEKLKTLNEQDLTNLLIRLMRTEQQVITALVGHGEGDFSRQGSKDLSDLGKKLSSRGFQLDILNFASGQDLSSRESVLVIGAPTLTLLPGEVNRIKRYLQGGGNLLWMVDDETTAGLDAIAEALGVALPNGVVIDPGARSQSGSIAFSLAQQYADHPVTELMNVNTVFPYARGIFQSNNTGYSFTPLITVAPQGWIETRGLKNATYQENEDIKGPITIAAAMERNVDDKRQRVVIVGSGKAFSNEFLASLGNSDLSTNIVNWISGDDKLISIAPKSRIDMSLNLPPLAISLIVSGFLFAGPIALLIAGTFIWWLRRRA
ncbi:GldG family protein [Burkholderiales bacterium]|nr:GldG family protein [Burkholderiales bacterium]